MCGEDSCARVGGAGQGRSVDTVCGVRSSGVSREFGRGTGGGGARGARRIHFAGAAAVLGGRSGGRLGRESSEQADGGGRHYMRVKTPRASASFFEAAAVALDSLRNN